MGRIFFWSFFVFPARIFNSTWTLVFYPPINSNAVVWLRNDKENNDCRWIMSVVFLSRSFAIGETHYLSRKRYILLHLFLRPLIIFPLVLNDNRLCKKKWAHTRSLVFSNNKFLLTRFLNSTLWFAYFYVILYPFFFWLCNLSTSVL